MATTLPRITARVDFDTQELLQQAAAISGISSINSFVLNAAIEKAKKILEYEQTLKLTKHDAMLLIDALDSEAKPNVRLQQAAQRYSDKEQL
ncbi:MAG: DUF1778 domain-containing protein [Thiotrichaceae bacterium]